MKKAGWTTGCAARRPPGRSDREVLRLTAPEQRLRPERSRQEQPRQPRNPRERLQQERPRRQEQQPRQERPQEQEQLLPSCHRRRSARAPGQRHQKSSRSSSIPQLRLLRCDPQPCPPDGNHPPEPAGGRAIVGFPGTNSTFFDTPGTHPDDGIPRNASSVGPARGGAASRPPPPGCVSAAAVVQAPSTRLILASWSHQVPPSPRVRTTCIRPTCAH